MREKESSSGVCARLMIYGSCRQSVRFLGVMHVALLELYFRF